MNAPLLICAMLASLALVACERPTVVNVPTPVATPGPAGPQGATGTQGMKGETGKAGDGTTLIVVPPAASAPAN